MKRIFQEGGDQLVSRNEVADVLFAPNDKVQQELSSSLRELFELGKGFGDNFTGKFNRLTVDDCDSEQIWQQLQISSKDLLDHQEGVNMEAEGSSEEEIEEEDFLASEEEDKNEVSSDDDKEPEVDREKESKKLDSAITSDDVQKEDLPETTDVQDEFLIDEFEKFHAMMEGKDENELEESDEENDDEGLEALKYHGAIEESDLNEMLDKGKMKEAEKEKMELAENLSTYERNQLSIQATIQRLEEQSLAGRGWQLMGEADSSTRPKDSLILQDLQFERGDKLKPVITPEKTEEIEDIIRQRILDLRFDDVERKEVPKGRKKRRLVEVESDKSKFGLAEIYEREFLDKAKESAGLQTAQQEKLSKEHQEINKLKTELFYQLDTLTSFHFTPRPVDNVNIEVASNVAAIEMEETVPIAQAQPDVVMEAPEEIYKPDKKVQVGDSEKTRKEKRAEHRSRKRRKRKHETKKTRDEELLENYRSKRRKKDSGKTLLQKLGAVDSQKKHNFGSKAVFTILQDRKESREQDKKQTKKKAPSTKLKL